ncbi:hypothetical protein GQ607_000223 [Colletotrichum asianum]|uniref:Uncharacterized protein n=1 Tax=Colletotrichum asianum TaxID=702518 RepID=A0A8H3WVJ0_9PEZI|nr:hypothetical protein GQ607_000223 [Colletotrichum asianum]
MESGRLGTEENAVVVVAAANWPPAATGTCTWGGFQWSGGDGAAVRSLAPGGNRDRCQLGKEERRERNADAVSQTKKKDHGGFCTCKALTAVTPGREEGRPPFV